MCNLRIWNIHYYYGKTLFASNMHGEFNTEDVKKSYSNLNKYKIVFIFEWFVIYFIKREKRIFPSHDQNCPTAPPWLSKFKQWFTLKVINWHRLYLDLKVASGSEKHLGLIFFTLKYFMISEHLLGLIKTNYYCFWQEYFPL